MMDERRKSFPFPDREESREELVRDLLYQKIPEEKLDEIFEEAWNQGVQAAQMIFARYPGQKIREVAGALGLKIQRVEADQVAGNMRYFSEYYSGRKTIYLYMESVRKWAKANDLTEKHAVDLILSHEIFHHLECSEIGLTSEHYHVPALTIGRWKFGKSGIRALSEVGAHGFSRTYCELKNT